LIECAHRNSVIPPVSDVNEYLREQRRTLRAKLVTEMATS
jgi:hypothetical protein